MKITFNKIKNKKTNKGDTEDIIQKNNKKYKEEEQIKNTT